MKTKLLKKLRKRFGWYLNKNGFPVLINRIKKEAVVIDPAYLCIKLNMDINNLDKEIAVSPQEWCWRWLLTYMLGEYGWKMERQWYRIAIKREKRRKNYENKIS